MDAAEALRLAEATQPAQLVPIHYMGWSHFSEGRGDLERTFATSPLRHRLRFLPVGERVPLEP